MRFLIILIDFKYMDAYGIMITYFVQKEYIIIKNCGGYLRITPGRT